MLWGHTQFWAILLPGCNSGLEVIDSQMQFFLSLTKNTNLMLILHCIRWHSNQKFISNMLDSLPACTNNHAYVLWKRMRYRDPQILMRCFGEREVVRFHVAFVQVFSFKIYDLLSNSRSLLVLPTIRWSWCSSCIWSRVLAAGGGSNKMWVSACFNCCSHCPTSVPRTFYQKRNHIEVFAVTGWLEWIFGAA